MERQALLLGKSAALLRPFVSALLIIPQQHATDGYGAARSRPDLIMALRSVDHCVGPFSHRPKAKLDLGKTPPRHRGLARRGFSMAKVPDSGEEHGKV